MIIETERLLLRPWENADAESLYKYAKDPRVGPFAGWNVHKSVEESLEIIKTVLGERETYAIVPRNLLEPVGSIGLMIGRKGDGTIPQTEAELGYWIGVPF